MKIVDHDGLMAEPVGTIFQEFGINGLGDPRIFGGAQPGTRDFIYADLWPTEGPCNVFGDSEKDAVFARFGITEADYAIWYPSGFGREGLFDDTRHFMIWDAADREKIAGWILNPQQAVAEANDEPHALLKVNWDLRTGKC